MMLDEALKKRINNEIANATVKILFADDFRGSGVFISQDGYVLTAYHCIGEYAPPITIETRFGEQFKAELDEAKSLKHSDYDIAVLKIYDKATHYLPLGIISSQNKGDKIMTTGYPAGDIKDNQELGIYFGNISKFRGNKIENDAMKGRGHSGGLVYHYGTHRVIGLVTEGYKSNVMLNAGLATRFDALFENWAELELINNKVTKAWDKRLLELGYGGSRSINQLHKPIFPFIVRKKALLEKRLENLQQRYDAVFTQCEATLNEGDKFPLEMQLEQLEKQIEQTEKELSQLF